MDFYEVCASLAKVTAERNLSSEVRPLKDKITMSPHAISSQSFTKRLEELENFNRALSSENASLLINLDDLRTEHVTLTKYFHIADEEHDEALRKLDDSLNHVGGRL